MVHEGEAFDGDAGGDTVLPWAFCDGDQLQFLRLMRLDKRFVQQSPPSVHSTDIHHPLGSYTDDGAHDYDSPAAGPRSLNILRDLSGDAH